MNLNEYLIKEGYTHSRKSCALCNKPRFFGDVCVEHAKTTLQKLDEHLAGSEFIWFVHTAVWESGLIKDLEDFDQAIESLYEDSLDPNEIANLLDISVEYVKEIALHDVP